MPTIDDVIAGLIAFRDTTYAKLDALQADIDELTNPNKKIKIWVNCFKCHGDGLVWSWPTHEKGVDAEDILTGLPIPPDAIQITCPLCKGNKRISWGWQETNPSEV